MTYQQNNPTHTTGHQLLSILAGWTPAPAPAGLSADDRLNIVFVALRAAGVANPRPMPSSHLGGAQ